MNSTFSQLGLPELARSPRGLIENCQGLVRSIAWKIYKRLPPWVDLDDLIADGNLGLAQAARDFDPSRGTQFTTYAYHRIRGTIFDGLARTGWYSPRAYYASEYEPRAAGSGEGDGATTAGPAADEHPDDAPTAGSSSGGDDPVDRAAADEAVPAPLAAVMTKELHRNLHELIEALPADARTLIRVRYFEEATLQEAARRLGISKPWATRLHSRALGRLGRALRCAGAVGRGEGEV